MTIISDIEARTHFASLLARAVAGEEIAVRLGGGKIVRLVLDEEPPRAEPIQAEPLSPRWARLQALQRRNRLPDGVTIRDLVERGRG